MFDVMPVPLVQNLHVELAKQCTPYQTSRGTVIQYILHRCTVHANGIRTRTQITNVGNTSLPNLQPTFVLAALRGRRRNCTEKGLMNTYNKEGAHHLFIYLFFCEGAGSHMLKEPGSYKQHPGGIESYNQVLNTHPPAVYNCEQDPDKNQN